jgi:hypothetical protein
MLGTYNGVIYPMRPSYLFDVHLVFRRLSTANLRFASLCVRLSLPSTCSPIDFRSGVIIYHGRKPSYEESKAEDDWDDDVEHSSYVVQHSCIYQLRRFHSRLPFHSQSPDHPSQNSRA